MMRIWIWGYILWGLAGTAAMAQSDLVYIETITLEGNKKTRDEIILRELKFHEGDLIPIAELATILEESEDLVMNTGLFNSAHITFKNWEGSSNKIHIHIVLAEAWYIYPVPVFELADRNFNVWWVEQNRSLQRINFGIEFTHLNVSGQKDRLKLTAKYGYTRSYSLKYSLPYINREQTIGAEAEVSFARNRELNYQTNNNKQAFYRDPDGNFLYQRFRAETAVTYRPGFHLFHSMRLRYQQNQVADIVATELNPEFFLGGKKLQRYFTLSYLFQYDRRDVRTYPVDGTYFEIELEKAGLGLFPDRKALTVNTRFENYLPLGARWSTGFKTAGKLSLIRQRQPYTDYRALGFGRNALYGYEYYIIDGLDMALGRAFLRYRLLQKEFRFGKIIPLEAFRKMPVKAYLNLNNGLAYINDPFTAAENNLNNRLLWGGGFGLDIVLYYDKVIQIQYSFNHLLENGLFLHISMNI